MVKALFRVGASDPTGLVQQDVLDAKFKFFASEESSELVVSSLSHTETVLPMCRERETT